jgi:hypothetical protein
LLLLASCHYQLQNPGSEIFFAYLLRNRCGFIVFVLSKSSLLRESGQPFFIWLPLIYTARTFYYSSPSRVFTYSMDISSLCHCVKISEEPDCSVADDHFIFVVSWLSLFVFISLSISSCRIIFHCYFNILHLSKFK